MRKLILLVVLGLALISSTAKADYYIATPEIVIQSGYVFTPTFTYWCNAALESADGGYYFSAISAVASSGGSIKCVFFYDQLNADHDTGVVHTWASTSPYGDPIILGDGSLAQADIQYP